MKINKLLDVIEHIYPKKFAENWDKIGLLICPNENASISKIIIANDLTMDVVDFAKRRGAQLILAYHPLIFQPMSAISNCGSWQQRVAIQCIKNDIAVYSLHTVLDNITNGINDFISNYFDYSSKFPIISSDFLKGKVCRKFNGKHISSDLFERIIKSKSHLHFDKNNKLNNIFFDPEDSSLFDIKEFSDDGVTTQDVVYGAGRKIILRNSMKLIEIVEKVKFICGIEYVSLATRSNLSTLIYSIAICAGAGSSVFDGVDCDLYLTGEMSHHTILALIENGKHVIITNHTNTENPFLAAFPNIIKAQLEFMNITSVEVECAPLKDPITIV